MQAVTAANKAGTEADQPPPVGGKLPPATRGHTSRGYTFLQLLLVLLLALLGLASAHPLGPAGALGEARGLAGQLARSSQQLAMRAYGGPPRQAEPKPARGRRWGRARKAQ